MGRHKKPAQVVQTKDEQSVTLRESISSLRGKFIMPFSGDSYEHSLRKAFEHFSLKEKDGFSVQIVDYFRQKAFGKSILVSYNIQQIQESASADS